MYRISKDTCQIFIMNSILSIYILYEKDGTDNELWMNLLSRGEFVVLYTKVIAIAISVDLDLLKAFVNRSGLRRTVRLNINIARKISTAKYCLGIWVRNPKTANFEKPQEKILANRIIYCRILYCISHKIWLN